MIARRRADPRTRSASTFAAERADRDSLALERAWAAPGVLGWLTHVDHKDIGLRYIVTAFVFFASAASDAALMRMQLARPDNTFLGPDLYNQIFTMHGTTMMFLFAVPVMEGSASTSCR